jgi:hypothetical protein
VRNDIAVEWKTLGIALSEDNKAAGRWSLQSGGEYYAVGAGTGISGYRADLAIIDDPFGSREDAYSETVRKGRWNWYLDDFSARLKPGPNASSSPRAGMRKTSPGWCCSRSSARRLPAR